MTDRNRKVFPFVFAAFLSVLIGCTSTPLKPKAIVGAPEEKIAQVSSIKYEFALVEGGCFDMGCNSSTGNCGKDSQPMHSVCVDSFLMGRTEVTKEQFQFFKDQILSDDTAGHNLANFQNEGTGTQFYSKKLFASAERNRLLLKHPATNVSWYAAKMMADWMSQKSDLMVRLPTEAEWEFACRSGTKGFEYGTKNGRLKQNCVANYAYENGFSHSVQTFPVASFPPNEFGLYDLSGNAREWCEDWYNPKFYSISPKESPLEGDMTGYKVVRGGSYDSVMVGLRCSTRNGQWPDLKGFDVGFRFAIQYPKTNSIKLSSIIRVLTLEINQNGDVNIIELKTSSDFIQ